MMTARGSRARLTAARLAEEDGDNVERASEHVFVRPALDHGP